MSNPSTTHTHAQRCDAHAMVAGPQLLALTFVVATQTGTKAPTAWHHKGSNATHQAAGAACMHHLCYQHTLMPLLVARGRKLQDSMYTKSCVARQNHLLGTRSHTGQATQQRSRGKESLCVCLNNAKQHTLHATAPYTTPVNQ